MCILVKSAWHPCGHRIQQVERCALVYPLPDSESESDSNSEANSDSRRRHRRPLHAASIRKDERDLPVCADAATRSVTHRLIATVKSTPPLCPVGRDCLPADYWSCCQCQCLLSPGVKGRRGGRHQKRAVRIARYAPSCNAREARAMLRIGDVCGGQMQEVTSLEAVEEVDEEEVGEEVDEEEQEEEEEERPITPPSPPTYSPLRSPTFGDPMDIDADGEHEYDGVPPIRWDDPELEAMQDVIVHEPEAASPVAVQYSEFMDVDEDYNGGGAADAAADSDSDSDSDTTCRHVRCSNCLVWRRCPCGCWCRMIIPQTRHRCHLCSRSKCRQRDPNMVVLSPIHFQ